MTKFIVVDATKQEIRMIEADDLHTAQAQAGLDKKGVDFGRVMFGMEIVVYEFGLREPVEKHKYFSIGNVLYAGNAVIFAVGAEGETVDITDAQLHTILSHTTFHHNAAAVEWNIQQGWIDRPQMLVNDELLWQWPQGNDAFKGRDSL